MVKLLPVYTEIRPLLESIVISIIERAVDAELTTLVIEYYRVPQY
jgi:hypothetical protein